MNIIIVGAGEVGRHLAQSLSNQAHSITLIESSEVKASDLNENMDIRTVYGNGASAMTLVEAHVAECELFLAVTSDDNTNLVSASVAKKLGAQTTIARTHGKVQQEWLFDYRRHFGIDYLVCSERLTAIELAKYVRNPDTIAVEEIARGKIEIQQKSVPSRSRVVGKTLAEIQLPERVRIAFIQRGKVSFVPSANEKLFAGDIVTLFGEPKALNEKMAYFNEQEDDQDKHVVIFGGNEYGFALAQMLEGSKFKVRILETDRSRCEEISHTLQQTTIIHGDATSMQQLKEEQIGQADFFIAVSEEDEDNVMTCLQANNLGAKRCVALVHRADYADVILKSKDRLGIHGVVSPREATSRDLLRFISAQKFHVIASLGEGIEVLEYHLKASSPCQGKKVSEISWPEGAGLVALLRENSARVPVADDVLQEGDVVYGIVSPRAKKPFGKLMA